MKKLWAITKDEEPLGQGKKYVTAAVVWADSPEQAADRVNLAMRKRGYAGLVTSKDVTEITTQVLLLTVNKLSW